MRYWGWGMGGVLGVFLGVAQLAGCGDKGAEKQKEESDKRRKERIEQLTALKGKLPPAEEKALEGKPRDPCTCQPVDEKSINDPSLLPYSGSFQDHPYACIVRATTRSEALLNDDKTFVAGTASGDMLVYDFEAGKIVAGAKWSATSSDSVRGKDASALKSDLQTQIDNAAREKLKALCNPGAATAKPSDTFELPPACKEYQTCIESADPTVKAGLETGFNSWKSGAKSLSKEQNETFCKQQVATLRSSNICK